ncbi:MAG: hypothetical protein COB85_05760 [Bacteroidetes bacterium]|nr:MAG: hypothetical protein COB85_05760 [Bacteroidota bacterium]
MIGSIAKGLKLTTEELISHGTLLSVSLVASLLLFSIFLFIGVPSVEDYLVVHSFIKSLNFIELFETTMSGTFNMYDAPVTSRTDIYRPVYELTFWIDERLSDSFGVNFFKISNTFYFFVSLLILSSFVNQHLGMKYAILAIVLYSLHSGHVHSQFSYVNRLGVLVSIYTFSIVYLCYQLLNKRSAFKIVLMYVLASLFLLTKETGVIVCMLPAFALVIYSFLNKLDLVAQIKTHTKYLAFHTGFLILLVLIYLYIRVLLFDGIGDYHPGTTITGVILNMFLACQQISGFKIMYSVFALPVILFLGYQFFKSNYKILLLLIFIFIIALYGPSLIYSVGKRYSSVSGMFFIFFLLYFIRSMDRKAWKWLLLASFGLPLLVQAIDIKKKHYASFVIRPIMERQLSNLELESDTIAVILPMYLNDEAILFKNGMIDYLERLKSLRGKQIIVLGVVHDSDKYYSFGVTKKSYSIDVTKNKSIVVVRYPEDARFEIPHLPKKIVEFDNKFFLYNNNLDKHEAVFNVKAKEFQVIYFEKLDYDKFSFKVLK